MASVLGSRSDPFRMRLHLPGSRAGEFWGSESGEARADVLWAPPEGSTEGRVVEGQPGQRPCRSRGLARYSRGWSPVNVLTEETKTPQSSCLTMKRAFWK